MSAVACAIWAVSLNPEHEPKHKRLTRFICQELLYEFVAGHLDAERQKAVDNYLSGCRDSQREYERLKRGLAYTLHASRMQVSKPLREALLSFEPQWKKTLRQWTLWSSQRWWKVLPYLFITLALLFGALALKPWRAARHNELVLVEQLKTEPDIVSPPADVKVQAEGVKPLIPETSPAPAPSPLAQIPAEKVEATSAAPAPVPREDTESVKGLRGSLTRGDLETTDFDNAWPSIRDKIIALGGTVAGNVELGWRRRSDEAYFHFSLPESNQQELELFLKTFGRVRFSTERHPRVMPEGQIRIILTVKDGGGANDGQGEAETP